MAKKTSRTKETTPLSPTPSISVGTLTLEGPSEYKAASATGPIRVDLDIIRIDADNGREIDQASIEEMARSLATIGQLQSIGLAVIDDEDEPCYRLVWGHRRVAGARRLGWSQLEASIIRASDEASVQEARSTENLQRQDWNLIEEAAAVARLMDQMEKVARRELFPAAGLTDEDYERVPFIPEEITRIHAHAVFLTAERLAKSATWVRDRAFLGRLSGDSRQLVIDGRLPLAHAREISKLADPNLRDDAAQFAAASPPGFTGYNRREFPRPLDEVKRFVARHLYSLAQVPWKLDVPFGQAPACTACPHNSANQQGLFEHGGEFARGTKPGSGTGNKEPAAGVCLNAPCYKRKTVSATAAARSVATKAVNVAREEKKSIEAAARSINAPAHVGPRAVMAIARDKFKAEPAVKGAKPAAVARVERSDPYNSPAAKAKRAFEEARRKYVETHVIRSIVDLAKKTPGMLSMLEMFAHTELGEKCQEYGRLTDVRAAITSPGFAAVMQRLRAPSWEGLVAIEGDIGKRYIMYFADTFDNEALIAVAEGLGIELPPRKTLEDFMPKAKPEKAKGADGKKVKSASAKKRKKGIST